MAITIKNPMEDSRFNYVADGVIIASRVGFGKNEKLVIIDVKLYEKYKHAIRKP